MMLFPGNSNNIHHPRRLRGITLVECLVSIVIVVVGLLAVSQCLTASMSMVSRSNRLALGSAIAQTTIDNLHSYSIDGYIADANTRLASGDDITVTTDASGNTTVADGIATLYDLPGGKITVKIAPWSTTNSSAIAESNYNKDVTTSPKKFNVCAKLRYATVDVTWNSNTSTPDKITLYTVITNRTKGAGG